MNPTYNPTQPNINKQGDDDDPILLNQLLQHRAFHRIVQKAREMDAINAYIKECIEPESSAYYHVLNLKGTTLVIGTPSQSFASRLRLMHMDWLEKLRQSHWPHISSIEIKIIT